jgi:hypothetical protein
MKRRMAGLLLLLGGFVGMVALLVLSGQQEDIPFLPTAPPATSIPQVYETIEFGDINAVRLEDPNSDRAITYVLADDGQWVSPELAGQTLDQAEIRLLLRTLDVLPYERRFPLDDDADLTQYGFQQLSAFMFVQFVTVDDSEHFLIIGDPIDPTAETPIFYALVDDRPDVYLIDGGAVFYLVDKLLNPPLD